jgi:hypothetical protein
MLKRGFCLKSENSKKIALFNGLWKRRQRTGLKTSPGPASFRFTRVNFRMETPGSNLKRSLFQETIYEEDA